MTASRQPTAFLLQGPTFARVLANLTSFLARLPTDKAWSVEVKPYRASRTDAQNRYLWGVCYPPLCEAKGYAPGDVHEWFCGKFFGWERRKGPPTPENPDGWYSEPRRTTTRDENGKDDKIDVATFSEFVGLIHRVAAENGIYIEDPDPMLVNSREAA